MPTLSGNGRRSLARSPLPLALPACRPNGRHAMMRRSTVRTRIPPMASFTAARRRFHRRCRFGRVGRLRQSAGLSAAESGRAVQPVHVACFPQFARGVGLGRRPHRDGRRRTCSSRIHRGVSSPPLRLSQEPQHGRVRVRPCLGRRLRARRRALLSEAAGRRALHAGDRAAAARRRGRPRGRARGADRGPARAAQADPGLVAPCDLSDRRGRAASRARRVPDPPRRAVPFPSATALRASTIFSQRSRRASASRSSASGARRLAADVTIEWITGSSIRPEHWKAFFAFYTDTGSRKWGRPYLTRNFFDQSGLRCPSAFSW